MATLLCFPTIIKRDTETGCTLMSSCNNDNATIQYEACRQSFYLKQQNEILKQNSQQETISVNNESKIADLQKMVEQQNQQITQLTQSSEQSTNKIENLTLINIILIAVLVVIACVFLVVKFMKRKSISK